VAKRFVTAREQFELLSPWRIAMPEHQLSEQIFNGDGEPNEAHHGGWAEQSLERNRLTGKTFHVPSAYKDVDPSDPDRFNLTQKLQRQHSAEAEKYVNDVLAKNGWNRGPLTVRPEDWNTQQRGATASYAPGKFQIGLKGNHVTELTLLHEMAHALLDTTHDNYHGHEFKNQLHDLIHQNLGEEAGNIYGDIGFRDISPNQLALPLFKRDRTAAVHDQLMQIVAMADTTPWHPLITPVHSVNRRHVTYVLPEKQGKEGDMKPPLARLEVTIHNKGDKQWKDEFGGYGKREDNEAYIDSIIVHPQFQGQGMAQALIERLNKDYPEHKINPGVTTPKGYGFVQRMKQLVPDAKEKIAPVYTPSVMDDEDAAEYESSEYANVGHEDYDEDDYSSEYNPPKRPTENTYSITFGEPPSRQLVNASYDDGPYWGAAWDDEDEDDEDDWPEGTVPKQHKKRGTTELMNAPHYVGVDEAPYEGKHRKEEEPSRFRKWLKSWNPDQIALDLSGKRVATQQFLAMAWDEWAPQIKTLGPSKEGTRVGIYYIPHTENQKEDSQVAFTVHPDDRISIAGIETNYNFRNQGVAEALMRRIHQDFPNHKIEPGKMTVNGRGFHDRMLEKEPAAKDVVAARFWHTAMAWQDYADKIQHKPPREPGGEGRYYVDHPEWGGGVESYLNYSLKQRPKRAFINMIDTNWLNQHDGVAEALMRRLNQDYPDHKIVPGAMTNDGQGFYKRMLKKEPKAKELVAARFWRTSMPTWYHLTNDRRFQLDPDHMPVNFNDTGDSSGSGALGSGVFLTQRPDEWATMPPPEEGDWNGNRPYIAEIDAPDDLHNLPGVWHDPNSTRPTDPFPGADEIFVPDHQFHNLTVKNVRPRTAMPAPAPEGLRFQPGTPRSHGLGRTDAYIGDDPVGHLEWLDDDNPWSIVTKRKPGEVSHIYVHPNARRQSVATEMFDWTKNNMRPDLHHSERRTDLGDSWVNYEQNRVASQRFWNAS
jgi:ribosomal protein S18 acetylase RimI-like enzyme